MVFLKVSDDTIIDMSKVTLLRTEASLGRGTFCIMFYNYEGGIVASLSFNTFDEMSEHFDILAKGMYHLNEKCKHLIGKGIVNG
jgi:hypothetical protein